MHHRTQPSRSSSVREGEITHPALTSLFNEVRLLWHVMSTVAERLHEEEGVTPGMRSVLELLSAHGPATVPDMARRRRVSRQHIQVLVKALTERALVGLAVNPAHRRSGLVELTQQGREVFDRLSRREQRYLARLAPPAGDEAVAQAAATVREIREMMEAS
jgi:DNA-binding MarR family transcriptional regulator